MFYVNFILLQTFLILNWVPVIGKTHILYVSLTQSTRAVTVVPLFNALLETVK